MERRKPFSRKTPSVAGAVTRNTDGEFIPAFKLRAKLGISAVTLWRWRHDEKNRFPAPKVIKGRLYFPVGDVFTWLANQSEEA